MAKLEWSRSYLTADEQAVLSDFRIVSEQIIVGTFPLTRNVPGQTPFPTLSVYGGDIVVDGEKVTAVDHSFEMPKSGHRFLLFLTPFSDQPGRYQVHGGGIFEIGPHELKALVKHSPDAHKEIAGKTLEAVMLEIARAMNR